MRKKILLTFCAASALWLSAGAFAGVPRISIYTFEGEGTLTHKGKVVPFKLDLPCERGDILKTEAGGSVDISVQELAGVRLLESGEYVLTEDRGDKMEITLKKGILIVKLKAMPSLTTFRVVTPDASVQGSDAQFTVSMSSAREGKSVTTFTARRGRIQVTLEEAHATVTVLEGQSLDIPSGYSGIPNVRNATPEELQRAAQVFSILIVELEN